jgi:hypothetical protein
VVPDNALIVIRDLSRPKKKPHTGEELADVLGVCHHCGVQHFEVTYHLQLRAGSIIVTESLWAKLQAMIDPPNAGFEYMNHVEEPPAQGMQPGVEVTQIEKYPMNEIIGAQPRSKLASLLRPSKTARAK